MHLRSLAFPWASFGTSESIEGSGLLLGDLVPSAILGLRSLDLSTCRYVP